LSSETTFKTAHKLDDVVIVCVDIVRSAHMYDLISKPSIAVSVAIARLSDRL